MTYFFSSIYFYYFALANDISVVEEIGVLCNGPAFSLEVEINFCFFFVVVV